MEKYYVFIVSNGNLVIGSISEWTDKNSAIAEFEAKASLYRKDAGVNSAVVKLVDAQLYQVDNYCDVINKSAQAQPTEE